MTSIQMRAGADIKPGEAVYVRSNGKVYPFSYRSRWRRLLEWLHIAKRPKPIGIVLPGATPGQVQTVCTSDVQFCIGTEDL